MTPAEATHDGSADDVPSPAPGGATDPPKPTAPPTPPTSALARGQWLLRTAAFAAVAAGIVGVVVAPGIAGNAGEDWVVSVDLVSNVLDYFFLVVLLGLALEGAFELVRSREVSAAPRVALVGAVAVIVLLSLPWLGDRVPPPRAMVIACVTIVATLSGAFCAAGTPHTRALAGVLSLCAFGSIARLASWEIATRAGELASMPLFGLSRAVATASVFFDAGAQLIAVTWLGARGKWTGQLASTLALAASLVVTWSVAKGVHADAAAWQSVLHSSLADAPGVPPPYGLDALATFLVPASLLLALVSAAQPRQVPAIVSSMALALVSRGAFDVTLCALSAAVAAQWAALASVDDRAMWRTLIDDRARRQHDLHGPLGPVPPRGPNASSKAAERAEGAGANGATRDGTRGATRANTG